MADVTITGLPNASALSGTERVPMDQGGTTVDAAASAIAALATAATVGLGNVNNTSDANKPISTATQTALDGKAAAGAIGSSGLTMAAGVLGRESGTGAPQVFTLGSGLSIVNGALTASGVGGGGYPSLSMPTGFSVSGSGTASLGVTFTAGYSLPTTVKQTEWDTAYSERLRWDGNSTGLNATTARTSLGLGTAATAATGDFATAAQGALAATAVQPAALSSYQPLDSDLTSIAALTTTSFGRSLLTQADAAAARSAIGAGTSSLAVSSSAPAALAATAAAGSSTDAARSDHAHQRDSDVIVIPVGDESTALTTGTNKVRFRLPFAATLLAVRANVNTAPTGSTLIVDVNEAGTSVLSTKLSIDASETSSTTAATAAVISDSSLADDAEVSIDIDQIGSTVAGAGLKVSLFVRRA
jgi:hypothetical protein